MIELKLNRNKTEMILRTGISLDTQCHEHRAPTFQDTADEFAVRGDQQRLSYTKNVFGRGSAVPGLRQRAQVSSRYQGSPPVLVPHFLDQSYAPVSIRLL